MSNFSSSPLAPNRVSLPPLLVFFTNNLALDNNVGPVSPTTSRWTNKRGSSLTNNLALDK